MKTCVTCRYCQQSWIGRLVERVFGIGAVSPQCKLAMVNRPDPVTGTIRNVDPVNSMCSVQRSSGGDCGPIGRHWEPIALVNPMDPNTVGDNYQH